MCVCFYPDRKKKGKPNKINDCYSCESVVTTFVRWFLVILFHKFVCLAQRRNPMLTSMECVDCAVSHLKLRVRRTKHALFTSMSV